MRKEAINFLEEKIPVIYRTTIWWFVPLSAIFLLPVGLILTFVLGKVGFAGAGRLTQGLMLFSLFYGFVSGVVVLWLADSAQLPRTLIYKVKWLARLAVITLALTLLSLFLVFSH